MTVVPNAAQPINHRHDRERTARESIWVSKLHVVVCVTAWTLAGAGHAARLPPRADVTGEQSLSISADAPAPRPVPWIDRGGIVRWRAPPAPKVPADCVPSAPVEWVLDEPPVFLWRCAAAPARRLVGGVPNQPGWIRPLEHVSGTHRIDVHLGSARADAITLNTLEMLDPATGATIAVPPLRSVHTPPRTVPIVGIHGPVTCPPSGEPCYGFVAEGAQAGLLRIARDGQTTVLETPKRSRLAPIVMNDLQLSADGQLLFIAETWLFRGTKWVRFAIFDLARRKRVFEQRHGDGRVVSDPRLVLGAGDRVAISYRDDTGGRHVAVSYRVRR